MIYFSCFLISKFIGDFLSDKLEYFYYHYRFSHYSDKLHISFKDLKQSMNDVILVKVLGYTLNS